MLFSGGFQFAVDRGQVVKLTGHLCRPVERRVVIQHQFPEDFVDAVELLQARGAVEQSEGIFPHFKKSPYLGQVGFLTVVGL